MSKTNIPLSMISVASPCTASWDEMSGDDQARFCGQCSKYVYNLSAMTAAAAQDLIEEREGQMCVRFYRRNDGTMLTADCPVGWRAAKRKFALIGGAAVSLLFAVLGVVTFGALAAHAANNGGAARANWRNPIAFIRDWLFPPPPPVIMGTPCPALAVPPNPLPEKIVP
jgi:hypothetical protein